MSPSSIYCFLFLLIPIFLSHSSICFCAQISGPEGDFSAMKKNNGIEFKYIPVAICLTYLHIPITTSPAIGWSNSMQRNPFFQETQPSSNCGFAGITLSQELT